ncbi:hypothetical protein F2X81_06365 [Staphylococcus aureus]|nr:hypothetical protein CU118_03755 [Staphylococcus aureus]MRL78341.1 hypothetical protein [Staphylococcus aureus]MRM28461.1 hypothetical protein [Staphylococcus aureus]MRM46055.1 hypothetical protein [Staphylococcus aureus]MRM52467.1 hypothetical protein [Staphylococcus aureus]
MLTYLKELGEDGEYKYVAKIIGKDYIDGKLINTQWGTVHYSNFGSHIIPNGKDDKN